MIYIVLPMFIFLLLFNGTEFKITGIFILVTTLFALLSSLFMILYGDGEHMLVKFGIVQISEESIVRGLHLFKNNHSINVRDSYSINISNSYDFYSLMQHLKNQTQNCLCLHGSNTNGSFNYKFINPLRRSLKMRYQMIDASNYKGLKRLNHLVIPLLSQNIRRAHQLSVAMESKGFKDGPRTYYYETPFI